MLPQQYCLRWKYHHSNLQTMFSQLLDRGCFCDVTLACEGQTLKAHRVVLCACSTYFDSILTNCCSEKDPIIIMRDAKFTDIKCLIEFMYKGEINVDHGSLASLLKTAEELKIKGLAEVSWRDDEAHHNSQQTSQTKDDDSASGTTSNLDNIPTTETFHKDDKNIPIVTPTNVALAKDPPNVQHSLPIKKKRGRPPLDADSVYESYNKSIKVSKQKSNHVTNTTFTDNAQHLVTVLMDENSKDGNSVSKNNLLTENNNVSWAEQNLTTHMDYDDDEPTPNIIPKLERPETPYDNITHPDDLSSPNSPLDPGSSISQPVFLTQQEIEEWKDVIKMNDYLTRGRRPQFWEEPFCKRVMDAIKNKNLEMKKAAQILGVSYGTLYGRYRETYGCLKHPYRGPFMVSRLREYFTDPAPTEILNLLQKGGLSLQQAAELMNSSTKNDWLSYEESDKDHIDVDIDSNDDLEHNNHHQRRHKDNDEDNNKENDNEKNNEISDKQEKNNKHGLVLPNHPEVSLINVKKTSNNNDIKSEAKST